MPTEYRRDGRIALNHVEPDNIILYNSAYAPLHGAKPPNYAGGTNLGKWITSALLSGVIVLPPGGGNTASEGLTQVVSDIQLGHTVPGSGTHDFTTNRYQYLDTFNYQFDSSTGNIFMLDGTNNRVGIGTLTPDYSFEVNHAVDVSLGRFVHTGPSAFNKGGFFLLGQDDDAPLAANDRIGGFLLQGSTGVGTNAQGAGVVAYADALWTAASAPTRVSFETVPTGTLSRYARLTIFSTGDIQFNNAALSPKLNWDATTGSLQIGATSPISTELLYVAGSSISLSGHGWGVGGSLPTVQGYSNSGSDNKINYRTGFRTYFSNSSSGYIPLQLGTTAGGSDVQIIGSIATSANAALAITNSATTSLLYVRNDGKVGIGTPTPVDFLDVEDGTRSLLYSGTAIAGWATLKLGVAGASITATNYTMTGDGLSTIINRPAGVIQFREANANQVTIATGGNVGIGVTAPAQLLEVAGGGTPTIRINNTDNLGTTAWAGVEMQAIEFYNADPTGPAVYAAIKSIGGASSSGGAPDGDLTFWTGGVTGGPTAEKMRITATGNVGIGTVAPATDLSITDVTGTASINVFKSGGFSQIYTSESDGSATANAIGIETDGASNRTRLFNNGVGTALQIEALSGTADIQLSSGRHIYFNTDQTGAAYNTGTQRVHIQAITGFVGIGVNPTNKLHLYDATAADLDLMIENTNASATTRLILKSNAARFGEVRFEDTVGYAGRVLYSHGSNYMAFETNASEQMRIASTGSLTFNKYGAHTFTGVSGTYPAFVAATGLVIEKTAAELAAELGAVAGFGGIYSGSGTIPTTTAAQITAASSFAFGYSSGQLFLDNSDPQLSVYRWGNYPAATLGFYVTNLDTGGAGHAQYRAVTNATGGDPKIQLSINGVTNWTIGIDNSDSDMLKIGPNSTVGTSTAMAINTSGNVGIGTAAPTSPLHVKAGVAGYPQVLIEGDNYAAALDFNDTSVGGKHFRWYTDAGEFYVRDHTATANRLTIDTSGNLGIGTAAPAAKLDINGDIQLPNTAIITLGTVWGTGLLTFKNGVTTFGTWGATGLTSQVKILGIDGSISSPTYGFSSTSGLGMYRPTANTLGFTTVNLKRMEISSAGALTLNYYGAHTFTGTPATYPAFVAATGLIIERTAAELNADLAAAAGGLWVSDTNGIALGTTADNVGIGAASSATAKVFIVTDATSTSGLYVYNTQSTAATSYAILGQSNKNAATKQVGISGSSNNVTATHATALHGYATGATNVTQLLLGSSSPTTGGNYSIYSTGAADSYFAGAIGIGVTSPLSRLHLNGDNQFILTTTNGAGSVWTGLNLGANAGATIRGTFKMNAATGEIRIGNDTGGGYFPTFYSNGSEIMRITTAGNVGIGTSGPLAKLHVYMPAEVTPSTTGSTQFQIHSTSTNKINMGLLSGSPYGGYIQVGGGATYPLLLNPNGGNVGIGTTSPSGKLHVDGNGANTYFYLDSGGAGNVASMTFQNSASRAEIYLEGTTNDLVLRSLNGGAVEGIRVDYTLGYVGIGGVTLPTGHLHVGSTIRVGQNGSSSAAAMFSTVGTSWSTPSTAGFNYTVFAGANTTASHQNYVTLGGSSTTATAGIHTSFNLPRTFTSASGTAIFNALNINGVINQTGGASGISRGVYIQHTLTAAADYRAIDVTGGAIHFPVTTVVATPHTASHEYVILVDDDSVGGAVTVDLPAAAGVTNRIYHIKKLGTTGTVTVDGNGAELIDGDTTAVLNNQYESIKIVCDGTAWWII